MAESTKKYYWLKLKKDFFKRHDIKIIEDMENGKDYILFYLKLICESIDHEGYLRFSDEIPYNEKMISTITNTNIDIVRNAMKIFIELKMIEILEDKTIFMNEIANMMGSETYWAERKRIQRTSTLDNVQQLSNGCPTDVQRLSNMSNQESDLDIDLDKKLNLIDKYKNNNMQDTRTREELIVFLKNKFNEFFLYNTDPNNKFHILAKEIIEIIADAIIQTETQNGLKFNNKTYKKQEFEKVLADFEMKNFYRVINGVAFKEDIENRQAYILSCVINEVEQKVVKVGAK